MDTLLGVIKNWCINTFSNKIHSHTISDITNLPSVHSHENKEVLDGITENDIEKWNSIKGAKFESVDTLPSSGEEGVIYLVPIESEDENNVKEEYIYIDNKWELIGNTNIDLSEYVEADELEEILGQLDEALDTFATKNEIPTKVSELTNDSNYAKTTDLHAHSNKSVLDGITQNDVDKWNSDGDGIPVIEKSKTENNMSFFDFLDMETGYYVIQEKQTITSVGSVNNTVVGIVYFVGKYEKEPGSDIYWQDVICSDGNKYSFKYDDYEGDGFVIRSGVTSLYDIVNKKIDIPEDGEGGQVLTLNIGGSITWKDAPTVSDTHINDLIDNKTDGHTHDNKSILDTITQDKVNAWDNNTSSGMPITIINEDGNMTASDLVELDNGLYFIKNAINCSYEYNDDVYGVLLLGLCHIKSYTRNENEVKIIFLYDYYIYLSQFDQETETFLIFGSLEEEIFNNFEEVFDTFEQFARLTVHCPLTVDEETNEKVPSYGISGQVLSTLGNGDTEWIDMPESNDITICKVTGDNVNSLSCEKTYDEIKQMLEDKYTVLLSYNGFLYEYYETKNSYIYFERITNFDEGTDSGITLERLSIQKTTNVVKYYSYNKKYLNIDLSSFGDKQFLGIYNDGSYNNIKGYNISDYAKTTDIPTDDHINSLIDTKLGSLDGSGVAF